MNLRHAAALALVGWYLMTPPAICREGTAQECPSISCAFCQMDSHTPLRKWIRVPESQEYEYKTDCQRAVSNGCHRKVDPDGNSYTEGPLCSYPYTDCIATDDPRLKEN